MNTEAEIIDRALEALQKELGQKIRKLKRKHSEADAVFRWKGRTFPVEAKSEIYPAQLPFLQELKSRIKNLLVAADYITPNAKTLLRENDIHYVDGAGNMYLKDGLLHIHIDGIPHPSPHVTRHGSLFTKNGAKVVFQLLQDEHLINESYRDIAERSDVSLGSVPKLIEALEDKRFLVRKDERNRALQNRTELLATWVQIYLEKLKPTIQLGAFRPTDKEFRDKWKKLPLAEGSCWGGEPGGDLLTKYLVPATFTLYTGNTKNAMMKRHRWIPDENGDIVVFGKFWKWPASPKQHAPPLLIYADLLETGDPRCLETAEMIYREFLQTD